MRYSNDKAGGKWIFLLVFILIAYLAFFEFDVSAAYHFTIKESAEFLDTIGL